jgi:hypothetical protein
MAQSPIRIGLPDWRIIYTKNITEGFHRQIRKYAKNKGASTSEHVLIKRLTKVMKKNVVNPCTIGP